MARGTGKSGQQVAEEHLQTLISVLSRYEESRQPLPRYGAELNQSRLAEECEFDRKVFKNNPRCAALLDAAERTDRELYLSRLDQADLRREEKSKIDQDRADLEAENLKLLAENASLRRELERLRRLDRLMTQTGKLPS